MAKYKASIIVPIYKVEKYVEKNVRSLMEQDCKEIQIILVDDGSPDGCGKIIDKIAEEDNRIVVIHKKNGGVSSARNAGMQYAKGEYILFVDGDDWVEPDYVSYFLSLIDDTECFVAMNKNNFSGLNDKSNENKYIVSAEKAIEMIYLGDLFVAVWNKIYSTEFLRKNNLIFDETVWYGEGMLFNISCLQFTDKIVVGEKSVYHQVFNTDSAMRNFSLESNFCGLRSLELQKKLWLKCTPAIENAWNYHKYCFNRSIVDGLVRSGSLERYKGIYIECVKSIRKDILIALKTEKSIKRKIGWICYFICPRLMALRSAYQYRKRSSAMIDT